MTAEEIITMAEFSGHFYRDPRVRVVSEDARAYVGRFENKFDMIYSLSSNTFAALASGSFALAESYLFTTEAFADYWKALSEDGFMMMEHQFYMPRLAASLLDALEGLGVENPREHFAIYDLPQMRRNMILLSRRPLTDEIRNNAFGELTAENYEQIHLLFPAPEDLQDNLINQDRARGLGECCGGCTGRGLADRGRPAVRRADGTVEEPLAREHGKHADDGDLRFFRPRSC